MRDLTFLFLFFIKKIQNMRKKKVHNIFGIHKKKKNRIH